jgi:mono/diheme cytochrome c family protein
MQTPLNGHMRRALWAFAAAALAVPACVRLPIKSGPPLLHAVPQTQVAAVPAHRAHPESKSVKGVHAAVAPQPAPEYAALVGTYCVTCHNDKLKTAGLSLQPLPLADVPAHAQIWETVMRKVRSGEMPPSTRRPTT